MNVMKSAYAGIVIIAFVAIAVGGFLAMSRDAHHYGCIAETATGANCPENNIFAAANFHLDVFRNFSTATFGTNLLASLLVLVLLVIGTGLSTLLGSLVPPRLNFAYSRYGSEQFSPPPKQQFLRWLALHENSPASP